MAGSDTVRGIVFQNALSLSAAYEVLTDPLKHYLRVEGVHDVVDIEVLDADKRLIVGRQAKARQPEYTWGRAELKEIFERWLSVSVKDARFELVTDGRLGPTGQLLRNALRDASDGNYAGIEQVFGQSLSQEHMDGLRNAAVIDTVASGDALFDQAVHLIATLLPAPVTAAESADAAQNATNALYRFLLKVASRPNSRDRLLSKAQLAAVIGVDEENLPIGGWDQGNRNAYLTAAVSASRTDPALVQLGLTEIDSTPLALRYAELVSRAGDSEELSAADLASLKKVALFGDTGCGKSTTLEQLRRELARAGTVLVIGRAELYVEGQLPLLVAGGASLIAGRSVSARAGRDILADHQAVLAIDGFSELPHEQRMSLKQELSLIFRSQDGRGCNVILAGRDRVALRFGFPNDSDVKDVTISHLSQADQRWIVDQIAESESIAGVESNQVVRWISRSLGDGARNPLLFRMAASLALQGQEIASRAAVYRQFLEALAERCNYGHLDLLLAVAGTAFSSLLDEQKRYSDHFDWRLRLRRAIEPIADIVGPELTASSADEDLRRIGLVRNFGHSGAVAALHDSFADFLSAQAIARGLSGIPEGAASSDEQRLIFLAEIDGVGHDLASILLRSMPFLAIRLSVYDRRQFTAASAAYIRDYFAMIETVQQQNPDFDYFEDRRGRIFFIDTNEPDGRWLSEHNGGPSALKTFGGIQVEGGPLHVMTQIWGRKIRSHLDDGGSQSAYYPPVSASEDAELIRTHLLETERLARSIIDEAFTGFARSQLLDQVEPLGRTILIRETISEQKSVPSRGLRVRRSIETSVEVAKDSYFDSVNSENSVVDHWNSSSVDVILSQPPRRAASERVIDGLKRLGVEGWIKARDRRQVRSH
ncbi:ATP-binding protein [Pseudonocardia sp. H11422]|uniref:ATP-binding protein n=1 Tax=Pseudonocardia sp. H11422 TaxID=2835866 RepID=UPI001BDBF210|nr:ATP-binding protein [Pseudonocardia sp. H11422]